MDKVQQGSHDYEITEAPYQLEFMPPKKLLDDYIEEGDEEAEKERGQIPCPYC